MSSAGSEEAVAVPSESQHPEFDSAGLNGGREVSLTATQARERGSKEQPRVMQEGDVVILFQRFDQMSYVTLKKGTIVNNRFGAFRHDDMIGQPFGLKLHSMSSSGGRSRKNRGTTKPRKGQIARGWVACLFPSADLWTCAVTHRTQILYHPDISVVLLRLELKPGCVVVESGTGSGSLSTAIANAVAPTGHLYTFEFNQHRVKEARADFERNNLSHLVSVTHRDVCKLGLPNIPSLLPTEESPRQCQEEGTVDAVFLDLPSPWDAIPSAWRILKPLGNVCSFSPCIEQVQRSCDTMRELGFTEVRTVECLAKYFNCNRQSFKVPDLGGASSECLGQYARVEEDEEKEEEGQPKNKKAKVDAAAKTGKGARAAQRWGQGPLGDVSRPWLGNTRPFDNMKGHTGFLTFAKKPVA